MSIWKLPPPLADSVAEKIAADFDALKRRVDRLKRDGKRIVFSNGAFDLLHVGHVRSLRHARALGDHLVVAVNSDASVRRAKGPARPLFSQDERVELLACLQCVDTVFVFEDDTVDRLLAELEPHVHAKGTDYAASTPERATVLRYGGETAIVGDAKDHSSTDLQARLHRLPASSEQGPGTEHREE